MHRIFSKWLCVMVLCTTVSAKASQITGHRHVRHVVVPDDPDSIEKTMMSSQELDVDNDWRLNNTLSYEDLDIDDEDLRTVFQRYTLHTHALQWLDAVAACWREGGRLATPGDATEAKLLGRLVALLPKANITNTEMRDYMFIGIHSLGLEKNLRTIEGNPAKYISWLRGSHHSNERNCVVVLSNGRYLLQPCSRKLAFACDRKPASESNLVSAFTSKKNGTGESFKVSAGGRVFRAHTRPQSWALAAEACAAGGVEDGDGGRLALPDSGRRAGLLAGLLAERVFSRAEELFVDANDIAQEGAWKDTKGSEIDGNLNWIPHRPRMNRSTNCAAMLSTGQLVDVACSKSRPFLCEVGSSEKAALERPTYQTFPGLGRYAMHVTGRPWLSAAAQCHAEGATLAAPRSKEEAVVLEAMRGAVQDSHPDLPAYNLLVGVYSVTTPNKWRTLEGEILNAVEFNEWFGLNGNYLNQPYFCGGLWQGKYVNLACDKNYMYVCKKPL